MFFDIACFIKDNKKNPFNISWAKFFNFISIFTLQCDLFILKTRHSNSRRPYARA